MHSRTFYVGQGTLRGCQCVGLFFFSRLLVRIYNYRRSMFCCGCPSAKLTSYIIKANKLHLIYMLKMVHG